MKAGGGGVVDRTSLANSTNLTEIGHSPNLIIIK